MTDIAERLKELRADRGLSLAKLAKLIGASKTHVWEIERGRSKNPTLSIILGLCRALEVTPNYLLGFDDLELYKK